MAAACLVALLLLAAGLAQVVGRLPFVTFIQGEAASARGGLPFLARWHFVITGASMLYGSLCYLISRSAEARDWGVKLVFASCFYIAVPLLVHAGLSLPLDLIPGEM